MKILSTTFLLLLVGLAACGNIPTETPTQLAENTVTLPAPSETATPAATQTLEIEMTPTNTYPQEGYGPGNFPANVNPLTGLVVADPSKLERRPLMIKVSNIPRYVRPQWGLMQADHVYEYYTEYGSTRFIAIYLGKDSAMVGPIRSARFFDENIILAYKAVFAFGSADATVIERLFKADYFERLVLESNWSPMFRYEPKGYNHLMVDTAKLSQYISEQGIENGRQNLDGLVFNYEVPPEGVTGETVSIRYSNSIYNRWEYDPASGKYLRYSDTVEDQYGGRDEAYEPLTDRATGERIAFDNVVFLEIPYEYFRHNPEQFMVPFIGTGTAYAFRDGLMYEVKWQRNSQEAMVSLVNEDGSLFPMKPGNTWFQVLGTSSEVTQSELAWRFVFDIP